MQEQLHNSQLLVILQKYIENQCNENELRILLHWLKSPDNLSDFDVVSLAVWEQLEEKNSYPDEIRMVQLNREVDLLLQKIKADKLVLKKPNLARRNFFYRIAAVFLLLIGFGTGYLLLQSIPSHKNIEYTEISTARGETKEYTLNDGTCITLNSQSKLTIPSNYNEKERSVKMVGEAFFDVTPNQEKPFTVISKEMQVKVLGTSFNVKAYEEDSSLGITVSTGKVMVSVPQEDMQVRIEPMEHLNVNKETGELSKVSLEDNGYVKWIKGSLFFEKEPLTEVLKTINRKYDQNIELQDKTYNPVISGTHDNKSLEAVIEAICFTTGLKHKGEGKNIILYH